MAKRRKNKETNQHILAIALLSLFVIGMLFFIQRNYSNSAYAQSSVSNSQINNSKTLQHSQNNLTLSLFPKRGFKTQLTLGSIMPKLVESGAINLSKVKALYNGDLTQQELDTLTKPDYTNLIPNQSNSNFMLLILWAIGISNKNPILDNFSSSLNSSNAGVSDLASVGGWTLGTNSNAMVYFNKLQLINLTPAQQAEVQYVALHTYRPCCNNPTGFPDCNHGAALLALIELGASQGLNESQLYTLALQAQTLWFPSYYYATALASQYKNVSYWSNSKAILDANYSSATGWYLDVYKPLKDNNLLPTSGQGAAACGI